MNISQDTKNHHRHLSPRGLTFLEYVEQNPIALKKFAFSNLEINDPIYKLQPWPTFIGPERKKEIEDAGINVLKLIKSIPQRIFGNDPRRIGDYYNLPQNIVNVQLTGATPQHLDGLLGRSDFIFCPQGLKCIEYNVSVNIGGWESALWETLYHENPVLNDFLTQNNIQLKNKNLFSILFDHLYETNRRNISYEAGEGEMNTALVIPDYQEGPGPHKSQEAFLDNFYNTTLRAKDTRLNGNIAFCDYPHLSIRDGFVYHKNKRITALIEMCEGMVPTEIVNVFKAGNLSLYNGPISGLLSNKLNIALLSEHQDSPLFGPEEQEIIRKYIPWTRKIAAGESTFKGEKINIEAFILSNREKLIIKPSVGYGGQGVHIGPHVPPGRWPQLVRTAFQEKDWLVQEYIDSTPLLYQAGNDGCALHGAIFGFFVFGHTYAGCYVRVLPQNEGRGVINCYEGATVSVIFET